MTSAQFGPVRFITEAPGQWKPLNFADPFVPQLMDTQMIIAVKYDGSGYAVVVLKMHFDCNFFR